MKSCSKCQEIKEELDFYCDSNKADKLKTICIQCDKENSRLRYLEVKEKKSERDKKREKKYYSDWKSKNYDKYIDYQKKYREKNKDGVDISASLNNT